MRTDILDELGKFNPFGIIGNVAGEAAANAWVGIMIAVFDSGLWILRLCLGAVDMFLTPDLTESGPAAEVYRTTFWASGALVVLMALIQIGVAAFRRDGQSLGRLLLGGAQFAGIWACWITYGVAVIAACGGLTHALMDTLLDVSSWSEWSPAPLGIGFGITISDTIEVGLATVLGFLGLFLWIAAIGHFIVMLIRAASLLILAAVTPISAAGLVSEAGRPWFWKSLRWFHAAALTPVLSVLVIGIGVKLTEGVAQGLADSTEKTIGTMVPAVVVIVISLGSPVVLFRLLAFVDPGTSSGASMRAGLAAAGGVAGLLGAGAGSGSGGGSAAASATAANGQSQGEQQGSDATTSRLTGAVAAMTGLYGKGINAMTSASGQLAATGTDEMNQTAVGDGSYYPDYQRGPQRFNPDQRDTGGNPDPDSADDEHGTPSPPMPAMPTPSTGTPKPPGAAGPTGGAGPAGGGGGGAAAGEVPPVV